MANDQPDVSTYEVGWNVSVDATPDGGFGWEVWTDHPLWISLSASGRAGTKAEAETVARTMATRCTEAARVYMQETGTREVTFALMNVPPETPAGGGLAVGRLSLGADPVAEERDPWSDLEARAVDWQTRGGRQTFVVMDSGDEESGWRLRELFGCMGALGEQVALGCAAARDLAAAVGASESPSAELVRRAWAEHVIHWTMAAGHMLLNVAGRTVALDPDVRPHLLERQSATPTARAKALGTVFPCESDAKEDWPTFNKTHANYLRRASAESGVSEVAAVGQLVQRIVVDPRWVAMSGLRDEAFHRWRAQTAGVSTMTRRSTRIVGDDGRLPDGQLPDVRGPEGSARVAHCAERGLGLLAVALAEYDRLLPGVMSALTSDGDACRWAGLVVRADITSRVVAWHRRDDARARAGTSRRLHPFGRRPAGTRRGRFDVANPAAALQSDARRFRLVWHVLRQSDRAAGVPNDILESDRAGEGRNITTPLVSPAPCAKPALGNVLGQRSACRTRRPSTLQAGSWRAIATDRLLSAT